MVDTKDWTWVLEQRCPECGFEAATLGGEDVGSALRGANERLITLLGSGGPVAARPSPDVWSALEYGCHVRDVHRLYLVRLGLILDHEDPVFPNWDQDATAVESHDELTDLDVLLADLAAGGEALAAAFDAIAADQWQRTGTRSDGARFTVDSFGRYLVHDPVHHVWDVERGLAALR